MSPPQPRVHWTEQAARDVEEIVAWIAAESPLAAERLLDRIEEQAASLLSLSLRGRVVPELAHFGIRQYRELLVKPYRIVYRAAEADVYVLAVFEGRRDLEDVLLERLIR